MHVVRATISGQTALLPQNLTQSLLSIEMVQCLPGSMLQLRRHIAVSSRVLQKFWTVFGVPVEILLWARARSITRLLFLPRTAK